VTLHFCSEDPFPFYNTNAYDSTIENQMYLGQGETPIDQMQSLELGPVDVMAESNLISVEKYVLSFSQWVHGIF
jgi:hypothetical protein